MNPLRRIIKEGAIKFTKVCGKPVRLAAREDNPGAGLDQMLRQEIGPLFQSGNTGTIPDRWSSYIR